MDPNEAWRVLLNGGTVDAGTMLPVTQGGRRSVLPAERAIQYLQENPGARPDIGETAARLDTASEIRREAERVASPAGEVIDNFVYNAADSFSGAALSRAVEGMPGGSPDQLRDAQRAERGQVPLPPQRAIADSRNPVSGLMGSAVGYAGQALVAGAAGRALGGLASAGRVGTGLAAVEAENAVLAATARAAPRLFGPQVIGELAAQTAAQGFTEANIEAARNGRPLTAQALMGSLGVSGILNLATHGVFHGVGSLTRRGSQAVGRALGDMSSPGVLEDVIVPQTPGRGVTRDVLPTQPANPIYAALHRAVGLQGEELSAANAMSHRAVRAAAVANSSDRAVGQMAAGIEQAARGAVNRVSNALVDLAPTRVAEATIRNADMGALSAEVAEISTAHLEALGSVRGMTSRATSALEGMRQATDAVGIHRAAIQAEQALEEALTFPSVKNSSSAYTAVSSALRDVSSLLESQRHFGNVGVMRAEIRAGREALTQATDDLLRTIGGKDVVEGQGALGAQRVPTADRIARWLKTTRNQSAATNIFNNFLEQTRAYGSTLERHGVASGRELLQEANSLEALVGSVIGRAEAGQLGRTAARYGGGDLSRFIQMATGMAGSYLVGGPAAAALSVGAGAAQAFSVNPARFYTALARLEQVLGGFNTRYSSGMASVARALQSSDPATQAVGSLKYVIPGGILSFSSLNQQREAYDAIYSRVEELAQNPEVMLSSITTQTNSMSHLAPALADQYSLAMVRGMQYLASTMRPRQVDAFTGKYMPASIVDMRDTFARVSTMIDPLSTLGLLADGRLVQANVETLAAVYPDLYGRMKVDIGHMLRLAKHVPYRMRVKVTTMFQMPMEASMSPSFIAMLQQTYAQAAQQGTQQPRRQGNRTSRSLPGIVGTHTTQSQSMEITNDR